MYLKAVITNVESWKKRLEIEVPEEEVLPVVEKTYREFQKNARIDGFRKGKAPLSIIKKRYEDDVKADAADDMIKKYFAMAVDEHELPIVAPGVIQDVHFQEGEPFKFVADVEVEPEVKVGHYKGIKAEKLKVEIKPEDVDRVVDTFLEQRAEWEIVEGGANKGDMIEGDVQALDAEGIPVIGQKWENRGFILGEPPLGNLVEEQLLTVQAGDERRFKITPPVEEGEDPSTAEEQHYSISVKTVKAKKLPAIDDEFVKTLGDFENVEAFRKRIRENLEARQTEESEKMLKEQLIDEIIKKNDFTLPPAMIEHSLEHLWEDYQKQKYRYYTEEQFKEQNRPNVEWNLKWEMIWPKIAEAETLEVSDEEIETEIDKMAAIDAKEEKKIRLLFKDPSRRNRLKSTLQEKKVFDFLTEHAKIKEISKKPEKNK